MSDILLVSVNLKVAFLEDVEWNNQAFKYLVIDDETKELIKAVITTQLKAEENTDLIHGKGNGLFSLLHGGPSTGKTLTAESVAEIAKKPLYRVACRDIGTKAEEVEARNALVSVFLRVLEYYHGILILTSNRVGTFDEVFKSRIQLNLRYKNLYKNQRLQIWKNFYRPHRNLGQTMHCGQQDLGVNADEIRAHVPSLAKTNLNGREIRNVTSTARQLAVYRGQPLGYERIKFVIGEANKFDEHLKELSRGFSADDKLCREGVGWLVSTRASQFFNVPL
ncbi:P-loop containing nucleoside triphosphate hydrolase protein [Colletotrichum navitas]|uniref:P-loop containing nucleoside triphosphate hydrolase protein n=1 Tax=Colletotrichum navitas TaxID=681940 RepID=A0AAD8PX10_9PEZI|nr:P-loop containing nucleoside triphosphate hydrolase protein [Colletotrichum navitas]KAK1589663.1 P-loop containing nucleoside triphosphate hydrolase protein [Colletotrichum navitas]